MRRRSLSIAFIFVLTMLFTFAVDAKTYEISNYDVNMHLTEAGDFQVEEEITFHFLEGNFSYASREVRGNVFSNLEFVGIEGVDTTITDYEVKEGRNLKVKWYYEQQGKKATFLFRYNGIAGLQSSQGRNILDWTPTGSEWDVPIRDLDIYVTLPWRVEKGDLTIKPSGDLVADGNQQFHFHQDVLSPGDEYKVYLSFPEKILMKNNVAKTSGTGWSSLEIWLLVAGIIAGLIYAIFDIINREKVKPVQSGLTINDLYMYEQSAIFSSVYDTKKGITAEVFHLAKEGKLKLVSILKKGAFSSKKVEVTAEILDKSSLDPVQKEIAEKLAESETLKKFSQDYKWFSKMDKTIKENMIDRGYISRKAREQRKRVYYSCFIFLLPSIALVIYGIIMNAPVIIGISIGLFIISMGRLIKGSLISILSPEALYIQKEISEVIDKKKKRLEGLIKDKAYTDALRYFFAEIDYIILQRNFSSSTLYYYKKAFKKAENIELPVWLELDSSELDEALDALEIVEVIDYVLMSTVVIAASTGTTTAGGAGGGTAGGGGGGAG